MDDLCSELMKEIKCNGRKDALIHHNLEYFFPCIRKIPDEIREHNKNAYNPRMVSIGPLHRGKGHDHLHAMEAVKFRYMTCLLNRVTSDESAALLSHWVDVLSQMEAVVRECYAEEITLDSREFVKTMVIDGCFIIELLQRFQNNEADPILNNSFRYAAVKHDLVLLENQIPFFVLQQLFSRLRIVGFHEFPYLTECLYSFFGNMMGNRLPYQTREPGMDTIKDEGDAPNVYHILHLLHRRYLPSSRVHKADTRACVQVEQPAAWKDETDISACIQIEEAAAERDETWKYFNYSATELDMVGVKLEPAAASSNGNVVDLLDLKFSTDRPSCFSLCRRARFKIPPFHIDDITGPLLGNLVAFEQTCIGIERYFTPYATLMDILINCTEDVKLLEEVGIIRSTFGSREEVFLLFNNISNNSSLNNLVFEKPCIKVNEYCKQSWPKFLVKLRRDYFNSPWTIISIIAAFILFVLTLLQTIYTMLSYY